jgi:DNA repair ATPase RecN
MGLQDLESRISDRRRELDQLAGEARTVLQHGKELREAIEQLQEEVMTLDKSTVLLNSIAEDTQLAAQHNIEELVTRGLQTIFDESLSFHILQSTKGKSASVEFVVRTQLLNGQAVDTPVMDARGGGLAATIGFLLRVVVMLLRRQENILILDETFAMVSAEYLPALGEFVRQLVDKTDLQIVMVTHQPEFAAYADKVYRFSQDDGRTQVHAE